MKTVRDSSLLEYARQFWSHERHKGGHVPVELGRGQSPVKWLACKYIDKIPYEFEHDFRVQIVELDQSEVEALRVHNRIVDDQWMRERKLVTSPHTNVLGELAIPFSGQPWPGDSGQKKNYDKWKQSGSLEGVFANDMPMIQDNRDGTFEIVDGWGRLLPYVALVREGLPFFSVPCFLAIRA